MYPIGGVLLVLATVTALSQALFPTGQELLYRYHANIQSGTLEPALGASQWELRGKLTVQGRKDSAVLQLSDLEVSLYNGKPNHTPSPKNSFQHIPPEANELSKLFTVYYEGSKATALSVSKDEHLWSINMKRALASLLQLEETQLHNPAFSTQENNLFGQCLAEYSVIKEDNKTVVRKFIDHETCTGFPSTTWSNVAPLHPVCSSGSKTMSSSGGRSYVLVQAEGGGLKLESLVANSGINVQSIQAQGQLQYSFVKQTFVLEAYDGIESLKVQDDGVKVGLLYEQAVNDLTQGRDPPNMKYILKIVNKYLEQLSESIETNLNTADPETLHNELVPHLLHFLGLLDGVNLEQYYEMFAIGTSYHQETLRNLFLSLLPQVGSHASVLFIRNLIRDNRVKPQTAMKLLNVLPFYVHKPSEQLLKECEELLSLSEDIELEVKHVAVLTFSTLVYKTCQQHCQPTTLDIYVNQFMDRFTGSTSYAEQLLYLEALSNIETGNVFDFIEPIIRGNVTYLSAKPHHVRFLGVWATMARAPYNPDKVYQIYWPILANRTEHLEMRVAALTMLVLSKPTHGNFLNLLWFMHTETNAHLLHFYYTTLESLANTNYPCYIHLGKLAARVIQYVKPPSVRNWATGNYILDYSDPKYGFGSLSQLFAVANQRTGNPNVFYLLLNSHALGLSLVQIGLYLKLEGVSDAAIQMLRRINSDSLNIPQLAAVLQEFKVPTISSEPVHIEIIAKVEGRVVLCQYINHTTFYKLGEVVSRLSAILPEFHINHQGAKASLLVEANQPSDLGTPVLLRLDTSMLHSVRGNFTRELLTHRNQLDIRYSAMAGASLVVYNPVLNLWHVARKSHSYHQYISINSQVSVNPGQWQLKFSINRPADSVSGLVLHKKTSVFVRGIGAEKRLKFLCPSCSVVDVITGSDTHSDEVLNATIKELGVSIQATRFDCEHSSSTNLIKLLREIWSEENKNYHVLPISRPLLGLTHLLDQTILIPTPGSCGLRVQIASAANEDTQLQGQIQLEQLDTDSKKKYEWHMSLHHKTAATGTVLHSVKLNTMYEYSLDNSKNNFKLRAKFSAQEGQEQRFCLDTESSFPKWHQDMLRLSPSDDVTWKTNIVWGKTDPLMSGICPKNASELSISLVGQVTKEQQLLMNETNKWPYSACLVEKKNIAQWGKDYTPMTPACTQVSMTLATLRKYSATIKYANLSKAAILAAKRTASLLEVLQPGIASAAPDSTDTVTLAVEVPQSQPNIGLTINKQHMTLDVDSSWLEPFLINTRLQFTRKMAKKLGLFSMCVISSAHISSLDNATHSFQPTPHYSLIAADCSSQPKFALLAKKVAGPKPLAVKLYTGGHHVEALPSPIGEITVAVNGKAVKPDKQSFQYPPGEKNYDFKVWHNEGELVYVQSPLTDILLEYNSHAMMLIVPAWYKGQMCGLCGDFNDDASNDG